MTSNCTLTLRRVTAMAILSALIATSATAATKAKPAATPAAKKPAAVTISPAEKTSALFYTVCAESMGSQTEFDKRMKALADAKTVTQLPASDLKGIDPEEAKDAWGTKGFTDASKTIVIAYNASKNICGLHVNDTATTDLRHAFQADLKKLLDKSQGTVKVYKPQTNGSVNVYAADIVTKDSKTMQLGIAIAKTGDVFMTFHL